MLGVKESPHDDQMHAGETSGTPSELGARLRPENMREGSFGSEMAKRFVLSNINRPEPSISNQEDKYETLLTEDPDIGRDNRLERVAEAEDEKDPNMPKRSNHIKNPRQSFLKPDRKRDDSGKLHRKKSGG